VPEVCRNEVLLKSVFRNGSTLQWSVNGGSASGADIDEWWVHVGSGPGSKDYLDSGSLGGSQELIVDGLASDGSVLYLRLWYRQSDAAWHYTDTTFTAGTKSSAVQITSPAIGDILSGSSDTFTWDANGLPVDQWWLYVGTTQGGSQIYDSGDLGTATSADVDGIVTDRSTVYLRLWYRFNKRQWRFIDANYTAASLAVPSISAPAAGSDLTDDSVTFSWEANETKVDEWWLHLGSASDGKQYFDSGSLGTETTVQATGEIFAKGLSPIPTRSSCLLWPSQSICSRTTIRRLAAALPEFQTARLEKSINRCTALCRRGMLMSHC